MVASVLQSEVQRWVNISSHKLVSNSVRYAEWQRTYMEYTERSFQ